MPGAVRHLHGPHQLLPPPAGRLGGGGLWAGHGGGHAAYGVWPLHGATHLRYTLWHLKVLLSNVLIKADLLLTSDQRRLCSPDHSGPGWPPRSWQVYKCLWPPAPVPGCRYSYRSSNCWWALLKINISRRWNTNFQEFFLTTTGATTPASSWWEWWSHCLDWCCILSHVLRRSLTRIISTTFWSDKTFLHSISFRKNKVLICVL